MKIGSFAHKGLEKFYASGKSKGLPAASVNKVRNMLGFLDALEDAEELRAVPIWNAHKLTGSRKGTWSLNVTKNWRLTFWIDVDAEEIHDVNLEDYH